MDRLKNRIILDTELMAELDDVKDKINEIVDWINKHEKNPPRPKPRVYG